MSTMINCCVRQRLYASLAGCALLLLSQSATADSAWAVAVDAGSTGVGAGLVVEVAPSVNVRAAWRGLSVSHDVDAKDNNGMAGDEMHYEGDLKLRGGHLLLDYHPGAGSFYLSAGGMWNRSEFQAEARCPSTNITGCEVGSNPSARVAPGDTIHTDISFPALAPYAGIGFGNAMGKNSGFAVQLDIGVLLQGKAAVEMSYSGSCSGSVADAECRNQIEQEEQELENDLKDYQLYPVLNLSLAYRFP